MANVVAIAIGLGLFLLITRSKWGKEHREFYYLIMLLALITVAGVLWLLSQLLGFPLTNYGGLCLHEEKEDGNQLRSLLLLCV